MTQRTLHLDSSTDGGASMRHVDRLAECCALLGTTGIAPDDLHKWSDVLSLNFAGVPQTQPARAPSLDRPSPTGGGAIPSNLGSALGGERR